VPRIRAFAGLANFPARDWLDFPCAPGDLRGGCGLTSLSNGMCTLACPPEPFIRLLGALGCTHYALCWGDLPWKEVGREVV